MPFWFLTITEVRVPETTYREKANLFPIWLCQSQQFSLACGTEGQPPCHLVAELDLNRTNEQPREAEE